MTTWRRILVRSVLVLGTLSMCAPVLAQGHRHEHGEQITPTAKELNEAWDRHPEESAKGFETAGRELFDRRFEVLEVIGLAAGQDVADIGAGSGLFSRMMADAVGPEGTVYAVEISEGLLDHIDRTAKEEGLRNVEPVLGAPRSPRLPEDSVDVAFLADAYHHFQYPREMLEAIKKILRPDGTLLLIDFERIEGVSHPFLLEMVRAGKDVVREEFIAAGFEPIEEISMLADQYILRFRHRSAGSPGEGE